MTSYIDGDYAVAECLGSFAFESAAKQCLINRLEDFINSYANAQVSQQEDLYRVDYDKKNFAILHIDKTDLVSNFYEPFDITYAGLVKTIEKRVYSELKIHTACYGEKEIRDDGDYATIYFDSDKIKYIGNIFIKWISKYINERNDEFLVVGLSDGKRLDFNELTFAQQLAIADFVNNNYKKL